MPVQLSKSVGILCLVIATLATTGATAQVPASGRYSVTDLGTLGGPSSEASGLNNLGEVVGSSLTAAGVSHAFLYRNGGMVDLGTLPGGTHSYGSAIADSGEVVGYSGINTYGPEFREFTQGFVWQGDAMRPLGALYCVCSFNVRYGTSRAFAVSNAGLIVGESETSRGVSFTHPFVWVANAMTDLGAAWNAVSTSAAHGINDMGEVVGTIDNRAFIARNGVGRDLGVLSGHVASGARAVNNKGQVVGRSVAASGISQAVLWDVGTLRGLGTLPGDAASDARDINVNGDVVGQSGLADFSASRAVLWRDGVTMDLNDLVTGSGWMLASATGINDAGQIVGIGVRDGQFRAVLLTPR